ncbi:Patatin-like phospholipase [Luteibacter sp. UNC138MFCol5.1]|uniref:patatin-like phospholipase family protein n=1 Tax=Luteibacter sp. UNC138MFCol5.1 TaxID=1502774 RepID=UPI0008BA3EDF|nr:patatin-like phospholipase family protein [Luteibacter sp. UNC138MFCol5.1]SEO55304.1 Patatin-like phospholipase [Luteibacter sp. UNC138MFCol5.1]
MPDTDLPLGHPEITPPPRPRTFELGLALAGAVSGGAYAAGVLDFIYEALERWYAAKRAGEAVPSHDVLLRDISGASAGSINGVLSAIALPYAFEHVHATTDDATAARNPFYDTWVNRVDIKGFLGTDDLDKDLPIASLLDTRCLDAVAERALRFEAASATRPYIANPLKLVFTVTNLRGVPYEVPFAGTGSDAGHGMVAHEDYLRFAVDTGQGAYDRRWHYPDDLYVAHPKRLPDRGWTAMMNAALASSAFPGGLRYREIERRWSDYMQRSVVVPDENGMSRVVPIEPKLDEGEHMGASYRFVGVDGGAMDNEPFELARTELAGTLGRNPRRGDQVNRIVLMVDPFPEPDDLGPEFAASINVVGALSALFASWKQQARFKPREIALAMDDAVYSRFLIAPIRPAAEADTRWLGARAIAAGALGGFAGFLAQAYRRHDFLLGRRNAQRFLSEHFLVPASNPIVAAWAGDPALAHFLRQRDGETHAPVIPLVGDCACAAREECLPVWPRGALDPLTLMPDISKRLDALYRVATDKWKDKILTWLAWHTYARRKLLRFAATRLVDALRRHELW